MALAVLVYEGGEALRFDRPPIEAGVYGVLRVLSEVGMITNDPAVAPPSSRESRESRWVRARRSGILQLESPLGADVAKGETLGTIYNSFGKRQATIKSPLDGVVIGRSEAPVVNRGDAVAHIAAILGAGDDAAVDDLAVGDPS